jgi:YHS domain-containing protein
MIARLIIVLLCFYLVFRLIRHVMGQSPIMPGPVSQKPMDDGVDNVMIQDPWCNVYFQKKEGVHLRHKGKDLYFCSAECRDKFIDSSSV